jgi:predicted  nucleic acid-binding Zn-ribbon protein
MPHQCTQCGHTFPDGSKEMLSGCPDCGGNKFQFRPTSEMRETSSSKPGSPPTESANDDSTTAENPTATYQKPDESIADESELETETEIEAKTETTDDSELSAESNEDSNMASLRRELDDQFESIKILEPGQYELNLMELYNREEYIIALQEDGQYVIEVPETWLGGDDS